MALNRVNADSIADGTVIASDIADNTITLAKLQSGLLPTATANSAAAYANAAFASANLISGVNTTQNTNITNAGTYANSAFATANTSAASGSYANSGFAVANSAASYANSAFTTSNAAVTLTGTQTLTNKTLTSPTLTTPNINSAQIPTVSGTAPLYMARAWVNFNGTGVVAIRASGNVTNITDNGTGDYTVNFTTAISDANYSVAGAGSAPATYVGGFVMFIDESTTPTTSAVKLKFHRPGVGDTDTLFCNVSIFR